MDDVLSSNECVVCGKKEKLLRCSGCQDEYYCGREHQKEHWKSHRSTCRLVQQRKKRKEAAETASGADIWAISDVACEDYVIQLPSYEAEKTKDGLPIGPCGIHAPDNLSFYFHALNNMAGSHKVDQPMKDGEENLQYSTIDSDWKVTEKDHQLPNGLILSEKTSFKRVLGTLGHGILVQGKVVMGHKSSDGVTPVTLDMDGSRKDKYKYEEKTNVGKHITMLPGSTVDGLCMLRGPLVYRGVKFDKYGGVHYNGCAFENGGYREEDADDERRRYKEVCIDDLVRKGITEVGVEVVTEKVAEIGIREVGEEETKESVTSVD